MQYVQQLHTNMFCSLLLFLMCLCMPLCVFAQNALPIASTVPVQGEETQEGTVVSYDADTQTYTVANMHNDEHAYGVTAARPALLFSTASGSVPVVHEGAAYVRVLASSTPLMRGDLLVASGSNGTAVVAGKNDENVFAVALEDFTGSNEGRILADISVLRAREVLAARKEAALASLTVGKKSLIPVTWIRGTIAAMIAVSALAFMLWSFRSIVNNGVVSVGRNPRAQTSIVTFAFGTVLGVVLLGALALFVAIAVLVLPV